MNKLTNLTKDIIADEEKYTSSTTRVPYYPLVVDKAKDTRVIDIEGNEFIDFLTSAAVLNTGHNHPKVVEAIEKQLHKFIHYTPAYMYHEPHIDLQKILVEITPGSFDKKVAFGATGSSSVDAALKAAKAFTKRDKIISFFKSYHGATYGALSVSGYSIKMTSGMGSLLPGIDFTYFPDSYRPQFVKDDEVANAMACIDHLERMFEMTVNPKEVAAIIVEPMQGDGGILIPPQEFFDRLWKLAKDNGIVFIMDEIQTGFGRTGKMFASEHYNIEPDIIILGKAIASGMPLSAIVGRSEIMESWKAPAHMMNHAGNVLSCQAGIATVEIIKEENLIENANIQGKYMMDRFNEMKKKYKCIGDVRGVGLLIGVDIVTDHETKERDGVATAKICWRCWENGLILAFFSSNVLRIVPPLTITLEESKRALDIIENAIADVEAGLVPDEVLDTIKGW